MIRKVLIIIIGSVVSSSVMASTCFGTTSNGKIENACNFPSSGENFKTYSHLLRLAGRTYIHCDVKEILLESYAAVSNESPNTMFVYGEMGAKNGGEFKPHKTHQNGLSVDFMTPVLNPSGASVPLPTNIYNRYGYDIDFTLDGDYEDLSIDYEAMSAHIAAIKKAADNRGVKIWRVLFDPKMQHHLHNTKHWSEISGIEFSKRRSWVRHDDHYHIDFIIQCEPM